MCGNADESTQTVKGLAQQVSKFLRLARATVWDATCFAANDTVQGAPLTATGYLLDRHSRRLQLRMSRSAGHPPI